MKLNRFVRIMATLVFMVSILLTACAPRQTPLQELGTDVKAIIDKGRVYYNGGVNRETTLTQLWANHVMTYNTFVMGARDLIANQQMCYTNVAATESTIATAVMSNLDGDAIFDALVTNSVSGEAATTACVQLNQQLANYIIANRSAVQDSYMASFNAATEYMNYTSNFPEIQWMNDLLQTYGDTALLYQKLADEGIGVSDWSWLPTKNLWASTSDQNLCQYYITGAFMENLPYSTRLKFTGHEDALARLYEAAWNPAANSGAGECRLYRYAALEYMTRPIVSAATNQVITTGEDQSIFPTPTP